MFLLDRDISTCRTLVVDGNPTSRSILAGQLHDFGVVHVAQCSRPTDARRLLETRRFDLVLCEQHFHGDSITGQDLLDDLRRAQLLPYATVFLMITGEARQALVAEAAESALDGYLLKPFSAQTLGERVKQARARKRALADIFAAIDADRPDLAASCALRHVQQRAPHWLLAARIGAEMLQRMGRDVAAQKVYEAVLGHKPLPWARLGVARARVEAGQHDEALETLDALANDEPLYGDALDLRASLHLERGHFEAALDSFRRASELTPGSVERAQRRGLLAFYQGHADEAARALERAVVLGLGSKTFDPQGLVLLGVLRFRARDRKGLQRCLGSLHQLARVAEAQPRLERFTRVLRVLELMLQRQVGAVAEAVATLAAERFDDGFDLEAACNLLTVLAELGAAEIRIEQLATWVETVALRFCATDAATALLAGSAAAQPALVQQVLAVDERMRRMADEWLARAGDPDATIAAVETLMEQARRHLNGRLLGAAAAVLDGHHPRLADADRLAAELAPLRQRSQAATALPPLGLSTTRAAHAPAGAVTSASPSRGATGTDAVSAPPRTAPITA